MDWNENYQSYYKNTGTASEPIYSQLSAFETWENGKFFEFDSESVVNIVREYEPSGEKYCYSSMLVNVTKNFSDVPTTTTNGYIGVYYYDNGDKNYSNQNLIGWSASKKGQCVVEFGNVSGFYRMRYAKSNGKLFGVNDNIIFEERQLLQKYVNPINKIVMDNRYPNEIIEIYGVRA